MTAWNAYVWTSGRKAKLRQMREDSLSLRECAAALGTSRGVVGAACIAFGWDGTSLRWAALKPDIERMVAAGATPAAIRRELKVPRQWLEVFLARTGIVPARGTAFKGAEVVKPDLIKRRARDAARRATELAREQAELDATPDTTPAPPAPVFVGTRCVRPAAVPGKPGCKARRAPGRLMCVGCERSGYRVASACAPA